MEDFWINRIKPLLNWRGFFVILIFLVYLQKGIFGMGKFTFIDLFAGIGGFHHALSCADGELVAFSEIATDAVRAYCENFNCC